MKKLLPAMLTLLGAYAVSAQVGIGTSNPSPSAQLQIVSQDRGVLIPQVQLTSTTDTTTITAGNVQSLLVYNVSTSADIKPGYYYWYINKWYRLINDADLAAGGPNGSSPIIDNGDGTYTYVNPDGSTTTIDVPGHQTLTFLAYNPTAKTLTYTAENGQNTVIDIDALVKNSETITTLVDNGNGTMTYTNEAGVQTIITKAQGVQGAQGVGIATTVNNGDGTITFTYTDGTTFTTSNLTGPQGPAGTDGVIGSNGADGLSAYQIWINAGNTGTEAQFLDSLKGANGAAGTDGLSAYQIWLNAGNTGTEAQFLASLKGADGAAGVNGTDGKGITTTVNNGDGTFTINYTDGTSTTIDFQNIETTTNIVNNGDGTYTYTNEDGIQTVIDVRATAIPFDNTASGISATTVQGAIDALAAANTTTNTQLNNITLVEDNDGKVTLVKADGSKVKVDKANLTNNGDGTYTFTNNDGSDVIINSNNLVITENAGIYIFADAAGNVLGSINTNASALGYDNTASGLNADTVQGAIDEVNNNITTQINTVALTDNGNGTVSLIGANGVNLGTVSKADLAYNVATGKYTFTNNDGTDVTLGGEDLTAGDNSVEVAGGIHALLAPANVKVKDGGITTAKLADDAVTSVKIKDGEVKNADLAHDAVSTDKILDGTILGEDIANETITNNKLDAGSAAAGTVATSNGDGSVSYLPVSTANLAGKEDLTAADGTAATIEVVGGTDAVLAATSLRVKAESITSAQIKDGEVKTADIANGAVTNDKLDAGSAAVGTVATSNGNGTVSYLPVSTANLANKGTLSSPVGETPVSILVNDGTDALLKNAQISVADGGITTVKLANDAVTNAKLADNAVQSENIKDGEVKNADLSNDAVSTDKILNGTILGEDIAVKTITPNKLNANNGAADRIAIADATGAVTFSNAIPSGSIAGKALTSTDLSVSTDGATALLKDVTIDINAGAVTEVKLGAGSVTTAKIADDAVTAAKINSDVAGAGLIQDASGALVVDATAITTGEDMTAADDSVEVLGGLGATLKPVTVAVAENGITSDKIKDGEVKL
ncbi:hypothetical protein R1T16_17585, partial [Flavobacterium sp. DG1-102-2]|uniref:beta strand repeat-containing protein n=1 Tax=Flavobacterium sp. DG1-102-2 TaxID=3081663 RepID=UPI002949B1FA